MNNQNLIIYQFTPLYQILKELEQDLNYKIIEVLNEKKLNDKVKNLNNYLIITKKQFLILIINLFLINCQLRF